MKFDKEEINYGSFASYETIKELILEKRFALTEAFDRYIEVTRGRGIINYPPGWLKLVTALNSCYLEIRPKIIKGQFAAQYKLTIEIMDKSIQGTKFLTEPEAISCTLEINDFCESMGVTNVFFEKHDKGKAVLF